MKIQLLPQTACRRQGWHTFFHAVVLLCLLPGVKSFQPANTFSARIGRSQVISSNRHKHSNDHYSLLPRQRQSNFPSTEMPNVSPLKEAINGGDGTIYCTRSLLQHATLVADVAAGLAWVALSVVALSYHPDPKFSHCSLKHNVLTMSQAFAFPLPLLAASFSTLYNYALQGDRDTLRRLHLGLAATFFYACVSTVFAPAFACGYNLYSAELKTVAGAIFASAACSHFANWKESVEHGTIFSIIKGTNEALWSIAPAQNNGVTNSRSAIFSSATIGFLWFTLQPLVSEYPLMTIPTILGKRLSRAAGAFTLLGAVVSYCLKQASDKGRLERPCHALLRRGLGIGSALHLLLIALKLIGVDDGGFLLPGRGLWEVYPAMMAVPFATVASLAVHGLACLGSLYFEKRRAYD